MSAWIVGSIMLLGPSDAPAGQATGDERLRFTFSGPVMVPGATLPAGAYTFQELNSTGSRAIVKITNEDGFDVLEPGEVPLLVEVIPDAEETKAFWKAWDAFK